MDALTVQAVNSRDLQRRSELGLEFADLAHPVLELGVRVMPYLARLRCHIHRQVHAFVIGVPNVLEISSPVRVRPSSSLRRRSISSSVSGFRECHPLLISLYSSCGVARSHAISNAAMMSRMVRDLTRFRE